jgi:V/A-type H+-transporting ATPase subunit C
LKNTVYAPYIAPLTEDETTPRRIVYEIKKHLAKEFSTISRLIPKKTLPLITQLYRLYEVDNLKAVLRGIMIGESWQKVRFTLFPLSDSMGFPAQSMTESKTVEAAIEYLKGSPYYSTLSHAMERFTSEQSLFPLEIALDLDYWRELWQDVNQLEKDDKKHALRLIGSVLDENNFMWAIRYRVYHNLSEEEIINYTLPFGYRVKDDDIRAIAASADAGYIVSRVYPALAGNTSLLDDLEKHLPELELELQRSTLRECREAFIGYPFHAGISIAYLLLIEMEIQDLTVLIEAKSMGMPAKRFKHYLLFGCQPADELV